VSTIAFSQSVDAHRLSLLSGLGRLDLSGRSRRWSQRRAVARASRRGADV